MAFHPALSWLVAGIRLKVDVIDTWDMSIASLEKTHDVECADRHAFPNQDFIHSTFVNSFGIDCGTALDRHCYAGRNGAMGEGTWRTMNHFPLDLPAVPVVCSLRLVFQ